MSQTVQGTLLHVLWFVLLNGIQTNKNAKKKNTSDCMNLIQSQMNGDGKESV